MRSQDPFLRVYIGVIFMIRLVDQFLRPGDQADNQYHLQGVFKKKGVQYFQSLIISYKRLSG